MESAPSGSSTPSPVVFHSDETISATMPTSNGSAITITTNGGGGGGGGLGSGSNATAITATMSTTAKTAALLPSSTESGHAGAATLAAPTLPSSASFDADMAAVTSLLAAASRNHVERVVNLLRSGISVDAADYDRRTAMHVASCDGSYEVVRVLIEHGANVNAKDRFQHTPLDEAVSGGHSDIVDLLRHFRAVHGSLDQIEARLIQAAADNNLSEAHRLLLMGVNPNCADYDLRTPLHLAVAEGHVDMAKLLLSFRANPRAEDRWGLSPLKDLDRRLPRTGQHPMRDVFEHAEKAAGISGSDSGSGNGSGSGSEAGAHDSSHAPAPLLSRFVTLFGAFEIAIIILIGLFVRYAPTAGGGVDAESGQAAFSRVYPMYQDVHVMIFIGFAFLMVFLRKHGYTSVGVTFLVGALVVQWYQLTRCFWDGVLAGHFEHLSIDIPSLVMGDFSAGAALITFGVVLGKVSPSQMLIIAVIETVFYSLNERLSFYLGISDLGGSMVIHMFGAFFGFAVSMMVTEKNASGNQNNSAVYHSDIMAMIGTIFLWMFWPSFNGALGVGNTQARSVINTLLSLCGSCVSGFLASYMLRRERRFNMVDIQNATLAGGVAMGACADLLIYPGSAVAIGFIAGFVSVFGFTTIQPYLETRFGLHDTCGVNNLHGMPSIIGGLAAVIAASQATVEDYGAQQLGQIYFKRVSADLLDVDMRSASRQAAYQFLYMVVTIGIATLSGVLAGTIAKFDLFDPPSPNSADSVFQDNAYWEVPELEQPYFFDRRGEISRGAGNVPVFDNSHAVAEEVRAKSKHQRALEDKLQRMEMQIDTLHKQQRLVFGGSSGGGGGGGLGGGLSMQAGGVAPLPSSYVPMSFGASTGAGHESARVASPRYMYGPVSGGGAAAAAAVTYPVGHGSMVEMATLRSGAYMSGTGGSHVVPSRLELMVEKLIDRLEQRDHSHKL